MLGQQENVGQGKAWPLESSMGTPARGAARAPPASPRAGTGSTNQLGLQEFTGHHLSCLFSLERRQEMLLHREELFLHKPYQEICVLKVLSVAEMNFPACYNMVVHLPAVILEFGNLNV